MSQSTAQTLRWPSTKSCLEVQAGLELVLKDWAQRWDVASPRVSCELAQNVEVPASAAWWIMERDASDRPRTWLWRSNAVSWRDLYGPARTASHARQTQASSIADDIAERAWVDCLRAIGQARGRYDTDAMQIASHPPEHSAGRWSGAVRARVEVGDLVFGLELFPMPPERSGSRQALKPLVPIDEVLRHQQLRLIAQLASPMVTVEALMTMRPSDVVMTPHHLGDPLLLMSGLGQQPLLFHANLVADGSRLVAQVVRFATPASQHPSKAMSTSSTNGSPSPTVQLLDVPAAGPADVNSPGLKPATNPLLDVQVRLQVCVGEAEVSLGEFSKVKEGHLIALDRELDGPVDLLINGRVVARGQLVAVDEHFAVRLTELPTPLTL